MAEDVVGAPGIPSPGKQPCLDALSRMASVIGRLSLCVQDDPGIHPIVSKSAMMASERASRALRADPFLVAAFGRTVLCETIRASILAMSSSTYDPAASVYGDAREAILEGASLWPLVIRQELEADGQEPVALAGADGWFAGKGGYFSRDRSGATMTVTRLDLPDKSVAWIGRVGPTGVVDARDPSLAAQLLVDLWDSLMVPGKACRG